MKVENALGAGKNPPRPHHSTEVIHRRPRLASRVLLSANLIVLLVSLAAMLYFIQSYVSETRALVAQLDQIVATTDRSIPHPSDLIRLTHDVCLLDTDTSSVGSFLQPLSETTSNGGWCGNYVRVFVTYAKSKDFPAHKIHLRSGKSSHTAAEIFYEDHWRVVDPFFGAFFTRPNGELATFQDLASGTSAGIKTNFTTELSPKLDQIYGWYEPQYNHLYRDALDFQWELNPSSVFHNGFIVLSYPMSLLTEGPRRPIMPLLVDRPELIGAYLAGGIFLAAGGLLIFLFLVVYPHRKALVPPLEASSD